MPVKRPRIEAYVLRFVFDSPNDESDAKAAVNDFPVSKAELGSASAGWRGVIIRVQTNEEKPFANFAEALAFIARDVHLGDFIFPKRSSRHVPESNSR
jgi:hypothetical protein